MSAAPRKPNAPDASNASSAPNARNAPEPMNWRRAAIGIAATIPVIVLLYIGLTLEPRNIKSPLPGNPAPTFSLARLDDGGTISLDDSRGDIVVLNFWASWCYGCGIEHPELIRLAHKYSDRGVRFLGMLHADTKSGAKGFLREYGELPYPTLVPGEDHPGIDYGITGLPETFVIDREGTVAYHKRGYFNPAVTPMELDAVLDSMLAVTQAGTR